MTRPLTRRTALALTAAMLAAPQAMAQQQNVLTEVSKYLNQLTSVTGRFTQINANGSRIGGTYYLARPGRLRFEYSGGQSMVIADGVNIAVFDAKSNNKVQRYPIGQTPLRFLLRRDIDLTERNLVRDTGSKNGFTSVVMQDPAKPRDGSMTLVLRNSPPALTQWTVREASGQKTTVVLETLEYQQLSGRLFNIESEARRWGG